MCTGSEINSELVFLCVKLTLLFIYLFQDHCKMKNIFVKEISQTHKKDKIDHGCVSFICDI